MTISSLMRSWPGLFPSEAVRVDDGRSHGGDVWIVDSRTDRGIELCASVAATKARIGKVYERFLRQRDAAKASA